MTETGLKAAAESSCALYTGRLESGFKAETPHVFSPWFEEKMEKLKRRAAHPALYRPATRAAAVIAAVLLAGSLWLTFDADARTAFFGWIKESYETFFVYRYSDDVDNPVKNRGYEPAFIPEGYTKIKEQDTGGRISIIYENEAGQYLRFQYIYEPSSSTLFVNEAGGTRKKARVMQYEADLILFDDLTDANDILWTDENDHAFFISAFVEEQELIRMAESVYK